MTSSNEKIFRVTDHLCGEFHRPPVNSLHKGQWRGALIFSLICAWISGWVNNSEAGDLGRHVAHNYVTVMKVQWHSSEGKLKPHSLIAVFHIWRRSFGSTLAQIIADCRTVPSHYLEQCVTYYQQVPLTFIIGQFCKKYVSHQSLKIAWNSKEEKFIGNELISRLGTILVHQYPPLLLPPLQFSHQHATMQVPSCDHEYAGAPNSSCTGRFAAFQYPYRQVANLYTRMLDIG